MKILLFCLILATVVYGEALANPRLPFGNMFYSVFYGTPPGTSTADAILAESGDYILSETGDKILAE